MEKEKNFICDVCGTCTYDEELGFSVKGINFDIFNACDTNHKEQKRVKETFGKLDFNICFVCWLKALGVKPIKKSKSK